MRGDHLDELDDLGHLVVQHVLGQEGVRHLARLELDQGVVVRQALEVSEILLEELRDGHLRIGHVTLQNLRRSSSTKRRPNTSARPARR